MTDVQHDSITDWATDFDHGHPDYAANAPEIWDALRGECPVAHTDRFGGAWLPTRATDVRSIAEDTEHFSSRSTFVNGHRPPAALAPVGMAPPITSDPPFHAGARKILLPPFAPRAIDAWTDRARSCCHDLLDGIDRALDAGEHIDAATSYAQHVPVRIISAMLGLPEEDGDRFRGWVNAILESPEVDLAVTGLPLMTYLYEKVAKRRVDGADGDDLISYLINAEDEDGNPLSDEHVLGSVSLLLIAGIDTTWSAIGAGLWHLATHPADRSRWIDDPAVRSFAIEEMLRFYAPVTMARLVAQDTTIGACPVKQDDWVLVSFPSYNRDPEMFDRAGEFVIDRSRNRHAAFGLGIHRCLGSNLARMELTVAIEEWMNRYGDFELSAAGDVRWAAGQVRGPRTIPVRINR